MQRSDVNLMYIIIVELGELINNSLKYCRVVMALICQKLTLTFILIVKYMRMYIF